MLDVPRSPAGFPSAVPQEEAGATMHLAEIAHQGEDASIKQWRSHKHSENAVVIDV